MRQAPVKDAAAPAHPFNEWNLLQYYTGKQQVIRCRYNFLCQYVVVVVIVV